MKTAFKVLASALLLVSASAFAGNTNESKILSLTKSSNLSGLKTQINDGPWQEIAQFGEGQAVQVKLLQGEVCAGTYEIAKPDIAFTWTQQMRAYVSTSHTPSRAMIERSNARLEKMMDIKLNVSCDNGRTYTRVYRVDAQLDISSGAGVIAGWNDIIPFTELDGQPLGMDITREN